MKYYIILFFALIFGLLNMKLFPQKLLPGITENLISRIQNEVDNSISIEYKVGSVLNVDSCLGFGLRPDFVEISQIEDPYNTLSGCYIFLATRYTYDDKDDNSTALVGIFKDGQILWSSGDEIKYSALIRGNFIWMIKDINMDGKIDILTTWSSKNSWDRFDDGTLSPHLYLWIVSWDGINGEIINDVDQQGNSTIKISSRGVFRLADIEGDGIWEIQGDAFPVNSSDSLQVSEDYGFVLRTFSLYEGKYSFWPNTQQPFIDDFYPRDNLNVKLTNEINKATDSYYYKYKLSNLNTSSQWINEIALKINGDSINYVFERDLWEDVNMSDSILNFYCLGLQGFNLIQPGEIDSSLRLNTNFNKLPVISTMYIAGWNTNNYSNILINSLKSKTLVPKAPPNPFIPINFIDTIKNYCDSSYSLGWIKTEQTQDKYNNYFANAKSYLNQNNNNAAKTELLKVLTDCNADSSTTLTSEAYALLYFNTEYLIKQIQEEKPGLPVKLQDSQSSLLQGGRIKQNNKKRIK